MRTRVSSIDNSQCTKVNKDYDVVESRLLHSLAGLFHVVRRHIDTLCKAFMTAC